MLAQHPVHRALALLFYMNALVHCDISIQQHPILNVEDMDVVGQPSSEEMAVRYPGKDAIINAPCSRNRKPEYDAELSLPSNVCLTWDPKMDKDILIHHPGYCPGGTKVPYLALYSTADCTGEHTQPGWYATNRHGIPYSMNMPHCLSNALFPSDKNLAIDTKHKSMILRCGDTQVQGADEVRKINIPTPKATQKPAAPKPKVPETASVSDSACYVSGLGPPRFLFQSPAADTCLDISPKRQLKIYRPAMCPNGTQSLLAKFAGPGCRGSPKILKEVTDNMLKSCIEMQNADGASSYAFWCSGNLKAGVEVPRTLFPDQNGDQVRVAYCYGNGCNRLPSKASKASGLKTSKASGRLGPTSSMATWLALSLLLFFLL